MCLVTFSKKENHSGTHKLKDRENNLPVWAYISIIDSCSHKCSWCYGNYNDHEFDIMAPIQFEIITDKLLDIGIKQITFSGGEPTEHPQFLELIKIANDKGFHIHIATHGEHMNEDLINKLLEYENVSQVQMNFQGSKRHNLIQGQGYEEQIKAFELLKPTRIETVATVTVGAYNLKEVPEIFKEIDDLGASRLRVIDATGRGTQFRKSITVQDIFERCREEASNYGYKYTLSYDPAYKGDITVPCVQLSNLFMDINTKGLLQYCGAVLPQIHMIDFLDPKNTGKKILDKYLKINNHVVESKGYIACAARNEYGPMEKFSEEVLLHV